MFKLLCSLFNFNRKKEINNPFLISEDNSVQYGDIIKHSQFLKESKKLSFVHDAMDTLVIELKNKRLPLMKGIEDLANDDACVRTAHHIMKELMIELRVKDEYFYDCKPEEIQRIKSFMTIYEKELASFGMITKATHELEIKIDSLRNFFTGLINDELGTTYEPDKVFMNVHVNTNNTMVIDTIRIYYEDFVFDYTKDTLTLVDDKSRHLLALRTFGNKPISIANYDISEIKAMLSGVVMAEIIDIYNRLLRFYNV